MIFRLIMSILAILFPWLVLFLEDNPGGAVIALIMQASILGWPFASIWALRTISAAHKVRKGKKKKIKRKVKEDIEE